MSDPYIEKYKFALKQLGIAVKSAHKTKEGKQLSADYWTDVVKMLKNAKLGISMMELGIDDESEIAITHDKSKETSPNDQDEPQPEQDTESDSESDSESDESSDDNESKLAAIGLKKESSGCVDFPDVMNHFSILLSEHVDNIDGNGAEFTIDKNNRKFTIKFDDKFFMISENYNFELGDASDVQEVVKNFVKLSAISDEVLTNEYDQELV